MKQAMQGVVAGKQSEMPPELVGTSPPSVRQARGGGSDPAASSAHARADGALGRKAA